MEDNLHQIKRKILNDLLFAESLRFSDLKPAEMEGSQFTFHLNDLTKLGLIAKSEDGSYHLTNIGKSSANQFDPSSEKPLNQAKHSVAICVIREKSDESGQEVLIYTRKKHPFFNHQGFPTGKVQYGENIVEAASRELLEETGMSGAPEVIAVRHYRVYEPDNQKLVEDKVMYICRTINPSGELASNEEGEFYWVNIEEVTDEIKNPLPEFMEILEIVKNYSGQFTFVERDHFPVKF